MQWVKVNTNTPTEAFELWNDGSRVASTSFNNSSSIVRMASNAGRRLFFYGEKGWFVKKPVIKNEYGIMLGKVEAATESGEIGFIEFEGKKYQYSLNADETISLTLAEGEGQQSITLCSFKNVLSKSYIKTKSLMSTRFPQLLLLLCWYSFNMHHNAAQQTTAISY